MLFTGKNFFGHFSRRCIFLHGRHGHVTQPIISAPSWRPTHCRPGFVSQQQLLHLSGGVTLWQRSCKSSALNSIMSSFQRKITEHKYKRNSCVECYKMYFRLCGMSTWICLNKRRNKVMKHHCSLESLRAHMVWADRHVSLPHSKWLQHWCSFWRMELIV